MTKTIDGVRDPLRAPTDVDRVTVEEVNYGREWHSAVVDDDGVVRWPEDHLHDPGNPIPWGSYRIVAHGDES